MTTDTLTAQRDAALAEVEALRANAKLAAFGAWCASTFREHLEDIDGGAAQDAMERLGVIAKREVTEPCGEYCVCAGYGPFPHECFAFPPEISAAIKAATEPEKSPG